MPAGHDEIEHRVCAQTVRRKAAVFDAPFCFQILPGTVGHSSTAGTGILAFLRRDIRARLHHCWANSLVDVCGAALKGVANDSRGTLSEMRAARDFHTVSCTPHHSCARTGQEDAGLANVLTNATRNGCRVCLLA